MGEFLRTILEIVQYFWPFHIVEQWERGAYYVCGRFWREVGPGLQVVVPYFTRVINVTTAPALVGTGREDITLKDGSTLSFSAMATLRVVDVPRALNEVDNYHESTKELIGSFLASRLAEVEPDRLTPEKRGWLFAQLARELAAEAAAFGVEVTTLRFTSFVQNVRTYRLLGEQGANPW